MIKGDYLELQFDKFALRIPRGLWYAGYDTWVRPEGDEATVGVTAYFEKHVGDILYVEPADAASLEQDDVLATVESVKATVDITCPASGVVVEFNPSLESHAELLNKDPYGEGWIARLRLTDWDMDRGMLLEAEAYFKVMQDKVNKELERERGEG